LLELLGESLHRKVTFITAPAGYGKTTLLIQWHHADDAGLPFAWVFLDEQDNDLVRMWRHIIEAVRQVVPEEDFGADVLVALNVVGQSSALEGLVEIVLPMFINELSELPYRVIVVLDGFAARLLYLGAGTHASRKGSLAVSGNVRAATMPAKAAAMR
jgi:LuxR family maltose regulon positive regulatory protein